MKNLGNGDALEMVLTGTEPIHFSAEYVDVDTSSQEPENPSFAGNSYNTATTHSLLSGAASKVRNIKGANWHNVGSGPNTITVQRNPGSGTTTEWIRVTLQVRETLVLDERGDWLVHDANGAVKVGASAASDTIAGLIQLASQAELEAATDVLKAVVPGRVHFHPGVAKCWVDANGAGTTINASYNITSLSDTGTGRLGVNIATDFSGANYCVQCTVERSSTSLTATGVEDTAIRNASQAAGSFEVESYDHTATTMAAQDPSSYYAVAFGDHA